MNGVDVKSIPVAAKLGAFLVVGSVAACGFVFDDESSSSPETKAAESRFTNPGVANANPRSSGTIPGEGGTVGNSTPASEAAADPVSPPVTPSGTAPAPVPSASAPSPSPAPSPAPAPAPSAGAVNSVETMITDMSQPNDAKLLGVNPVYGWAHGPGYVFMGNDPRWTNTPNWWKSSNPNYYTSGYWPYILPWLVMFEGEGNKSSNSRIHVRNMKLYIKYRSTGKWTLVSSANEVGGYACPQTGSYYSCNGPQDFRSESDGGMSVRPVPGYNFHGWYGGRKAIQGSDIVAVHATLQARLVVNDASKPDDRGSAKYLLHAGADYYPIDGVAGTVVPAVGISKSKLLGNNWTSINMTTLSDAGIQEPGGGISSAQLRADPPPIQ